MRKLIGSFAVLSLLLSGVAFAAPSQVAVIRAALNKKEQARYGTSGLWTVHKKVGPRGGHTFSASRPLGSGRGLMTVRYAHGSYALKTGKVTQIRVVGLGTAY
jgi:hypothetical protein